MGAAGLPAALGLLAAMEAGIPVPIPIDLVVLVLGERVAAGSLSLIVAALSLEVVAVIGTVVLYGLSRGPGRGVLTRFGPRLGLTTRRVTRITSSLERRGAVALLVGRATPGLRTVTVVAAGTAALGPGRALPWLLGGSSIFLQAHLLAGYLLGPVFRAAFARALVPLLVAVVVLILAGATLWVAKRGSRTGLAAWTEAGCPACLALGVAFGDVSERPERSP
ncbi:MAG: VTT domain-containing protein [Actinomycetota bacterium]|nr:VTT domain-containing protein [Actinomycetota bacterium]